MKGLIVIAVILAIIGVGFLVATLFTSGGGNLMFMSIGAGLALVAFILTLVGYVNKAAK